MMLILGTLDSHLTAGVVTITMTMTMAMTMTNDNDDYEHCQLSST